MLGPSSYLVPLPLQGHLRHVNRPHTAWSHRQDALTSLRVESHPQSLLAFIHLQHRTVWHLYSICTVSVLYQYGICMVSIQYQYVTYVSTLSTRYPHCTFDVVPYSYTRDLVPYFAAIKDRYPFRWAVLPDHQRASWQPWGPAQPSYLIIKGHPGSLGVPLGRLTWSSKGILAALGSRSAVLPDHLRASWQPWGPARPSYLII